MDSIYGNYPIHCQKFTNGVVTDMSDPYPMFVTLRIKKLMEFSLKLTDLVFWVANVLTIVT